MCMLPLANVVKERADIPRRSAGVSNCPATYMQTPYVTVKLRICSTFQFYQ
jgi:hypothetical protein